MTDSAFHYVFSSPQSPYRHSLVVAYYRLLNHIGARKRQQRYRQEVAQVIQLKDRVEAWTDEQLQDKISFFRPLARSDKLIKQRHLLIEALAVLREISVRQLGKQPYEVQVLAVLAMYDGYLVQLLPGEGKTLTIGLLSVLMGWSKKPCHVITANDYLVERDAQELAPFYAFCGLSVASVVQSMTDEQKIQAYRADLVYATVKQLLADYLIDHIRFGRSLSRINMALQALSHTSSSQASNQLVMRGVYFAIVDEADSALIDEAVTPMIISGPDENASLTQAVMIAKHIADQLHSTVDYFILPQSQEVRWTQKGQEKLTSLAQNLSPFWRGKTRRDDLISQAILARDFFIQDRHYVIVDDALVIVDEATGRLMPGRTWSYGLHQAIEARAGVPLSHPNKTLAKLSFQNYFRLYHRLTGASGTLQNVGAELFQNYRTHRLVVEPRLPSQLTVEPFRLFATQAAKMTYLMQRVLALHLSGIPILIGTKTVSDSEQLSDVLAQAGIDHQLLNAKRLEEEANIVAQAGLSGKVTVATNMAGRGTDIKIAPDIVKLGGLHVIMFEPNESARVDWQLFGRAGRQGQSGRAIPLASLEDRLFKDYLPKRLGKLLLGVINVFHAVNKIINSPNKVHHAQTVDHIQSQWVDRFIHLLQSRAERQAFQKRKTLNRITEEGRKRMTFTDTK